MNENQNKEHYPAKEEHDDEMRKIENELSKRELAKKLGEITVEIDDGNGGVFVLQADERSRNLMSQAIDASATLGVDKGQWKLADNTWAEVSLDMMRKALARGLLEHSRLMQGYSGA